MNSGVNFKSSTQNSSIQSKGMKNTNVLGMKKFLFGDGTYSQNIIQGGSVLQPQASYQPPDYQTTTTPTGVSSAAGYTIIDRSTALFPGMAVSHLGAYDGSSKPLSLFIARRNSTGSYTFVKRLDVTTATQTAGMQWFALPAPYTIPNDGYSYHVGMYYAANTYYKSGTLRAYVSGNFAEGATGSLAEETSNTMVCGVRYAPIPDCIVITGAATVAPDAVTGTAYCQGLSLVLVGATASLSASTHCKGLFAMFRSGIHFRDGAGASMTGKGLPGQVLADPALIDLVPEQYARKLKRPAWSALLLQKCGALGAAARTGTAGPGYTGSPGGAWQTGGGGGGNCYYWTTSIGGAGSFGTCFCGGSGGAGGISAANAANAATRDAAPYGGQGGYPVGLARSIHL